MALSNRRDYEAAFGVVTAVIAEWDPYGLFTSGAPDDEWDSEVASLVAQIPRISSPKDAAHAISRVFSSSLERDRFGVDDCEAVGQQLFDALIRADILVGR